MAREAAQDGVEMVQHAADSQAHGEHGNVINPSAPSHATGHETADLFSEIPGFAWVRTATIPVPPEPPLCNYTPLWLVEWCEVIICLPYVRAHHGPRHPSASPDRLES